MIDTDKYEGHTEGPWKFGEDDEGIYLTANALTIWETSERECPVCAEGEGWQSAQYDCITRRLSDPDKVLIADAPLLLAEVKRLRKRNDWLEEVVALLQEDGIDLSMEGYPLWEEE